MRARHWSISPLWLAAAIVLSVGTLFSLRSPAGQAITLAAPEFTHQEGGDWINSAPLSIRDLRGKVVLLDFWTFGCWNCTRSIPWLHDLEERFTGQDFIIVGIHTPEFQHEKNPDNVRRKVKELEITHPVMMDNDFSYWNALGTRYWPTFYLIDKQGQVRWRHIGETRIGSDADREMERQIQALLGE